MKFREATRSYAKLREASRSSPAPLGVPTAPHGVPFDRSSGPSTLLTRPSHASRTSGGRASLRSPARGRESGANALDGAARAGFAPLRGPLASRAAGRRRPSRAKRRLHTCRAGPTAPRACPGQPATTRQVRTACRREPRRGRSRSLVTDILTVSVFQREASIFTRFHQRWRRSASVA